MKEIPRTLLAALAACAALAADVAAADPASYPSRTVRMIVPYPAGGTADTLPRIVAEKLAARWGQPVIVDNRPGAGGNIGAELVARSEPDGYTLLATPPGPVAVNHYLYKNLTFDPTRFVPIALLSTTVSVLSARADLPAQSVQQLIELAKRSPGKLTFASQGNGSTSHLTAAMFQQMAGVSMLHVPYKGTAPALTDLIGGQVDVFFDNLSSSLSQHRAGRIKILAVASRERVSALPDVPSLHEAGLTGFQSISWNVIVGPEKLPRPIAEQISAAVAAALKDPGVRKRYADLGAEPVGGSPTQTASFIREEMGRWSRVIRQANVTVD